MRRTRLSIKKQAQQMDTEEGTKEQDAEVSFAVVSESDVSSAGTLEKSSVPAEVDTTDPLTGSGDITTSDVDVLPDISQSGVDYAIASDSLIEVSSSDQNDIDLLMDIDTNKPIPTVDEIIIEDSEGLVVLDSIEEDCKVGDSLIQIIDNFVGVPDGQVQDSPLVEEISVSNIVSSEVSSNKDQNDVEIDSDSKMRVSALEELQEIDSSTQDNLKPNIPTLDIDEDQTSVTEEVLVLDDFTANVQDAENVSDDELPGPKPMELPEDTEVVSEDELPLTSKKNVSTLNADGPVGESVKDAENVSDDELPGPKMMELPDDTEVVSEDELPMQTKKEDGELTISSKRKRSTEENDSSSAVTGDEIAAKKVALSKSAEAKLQSSDLGDKSVQDAENVSDDELPGPKLMELPADTEVVSEDELPTPSKKENDETESSNGKQKNVESDDTSTVPVDETASKKPAVVKTVESKTPSTEKSDDKNAKTNNEKPPSLPDLPKYWKAVTDDPTDFTGWTYLLQYVDVENDVEAAREAYDAFLSHYPYCYGYWRKYADYEKRKKSGSKKRCLEVLERGLRAIPLSVDLWLHYLNHVKNTNSDDIDFIRQQFERAISSCGMEFRSDRLWELYMKWENEYGTPSKVTAIYDRLLAMPTLGYSSHFSNFQEHIMSHGANTVIPVEEFVKLRAEVRKDAPAPVSLDADVPPGEDEADDHLRSEEEGNAIKEQIIAARRKIHKQTAEQVSQRWTFEEGIKRPYFHVKPLEKCQLKNWKAYIEWEKEHGGIHRTLVLFERCLIACALYEDYWQRYVDYLQELSEGDSAYIPVTRDALQRACSVHHPDSPSLHSNWASFEELHGNFTKSADILDKLYKKFPNLLDVAFARAELERRRGNYEQVSTLYEGYIASAKSKWIASALSVKFARFLHFVRQDNETALKVLSNAVAADPLCERLYLQQVDIALHAKDANVDEIANYFDPFINNEAAKYSSRLAFSTRKVELLESLGTSLARVKAVEKEQRMLVRASRKSRRKSGAADGENSSPTNQAGGDAKQSDKKSTSGDTPTPQQPSYAYSGGYTPAPPQYGHQVPYDANTAYQQPPYNSWGQYHPQQPNAYPQNPWGQYRNYY